MVLACTLSMSMWHATSHFAGSLRSSNHTQNHREIESNDAHFSHDPEHRADSRRVRIPAHLGKVLSRHEAEPGGESLKMNGDQVGQDEQPELRVAKPRATFDGCRPVSWIQVGHLQGDQKTTLAGFAPGVAVVPRG
jgi:hypothetical protein